MDRPLLGEELEKAFVRSCGPVLLGAKPANLFTFCGRFDEDCSVCDKGCRQNQPRESDPLVEQRRKKLALLVDELDAKLSACGVRCVVLAWRPFGALVYGYRPSLVAHHIKHAPIAHDLLVRGYPIERLADRSRPLPSEMPSRNINRPIRHEEFLAPCIVHLAKRFLEQPVPHEIGYFLGYPVSDVRGFIEHEGRDFLCCGCWKVYANVRSAQYRFARYKRCTRRAIRLYNAGVSIVDLARNPAVKVA